MKATTTTEDATKSRMFATLVDNPLYRRFYIGRGINLVGIWLQDAAISWIVFELTRSEAMLGLVNAAGIVPAVFVGLIAGAMADRVSPKALIMGMQVFQMLLAIVLAVLVALDLIAVWHLALILALARVAVSFEMPSRQVFLYEIVGRESLMNAIALNSGLFHGSRVIGPAMAGLLLGWFGRLPCFALNAVSFLGALAAVASIPTPPRLRDPSRGRQPGAVFGGLAYLKQDRRVRSYFFLMAFFGVVGMGYAALLPAYAQVVVRTSQLGYGVLMASTGLGATLGALTVAKLGNVAYKDRLAPVGMFIFSLALAAAGLIPPALSSGAALPSASFCLIGAGFGGIIFYATTQTLIQTSVPDTLRGRIMALWMITYSASVPLGSLWAGLLSYVIGVPRVLQIASALCLIASASIFTSGLLEDSEPERDPIGAALREDGF